MASGLGGDPHVAVGAGQVPPFDAMRSGSSSYSHSTMRGVAFQGTPTHYTVNSNINVPDGRPLAPPAFNAPQLGGSYGVPICGDRASNDGRMHGRDSHTAGQ